MHHFKSWKQLVEKETGCTIKILCTDNGGEYTSASLEEYLQNQGITHQIMAPYISTEWQGWAVTSDLIQPCPSHHGWKQISCKTMGECVQATAYLRDPTPTRTLKNMTPYQAYYGLKPDLSHLRELGCHAFILYSLNIERRSTVAHLKEYLLDTHIILRHTDATTQRQEESSYHTT